MTVENPGGAVSAAGVASLADHAPVPGRPYLPWVEAARTFLMMGVVLVHANNVVSANDHAQWWPLRSWTCLIVGLCVPTFFVIAGLVVGLGDLTAPGFDTRRFLRRKVLTLLVPFLAWNAIFIAYDLLSTESFFLKKDGPFLVWEVLLRFFTGYWHLYFVSALLQTFVFFLLVRRTLAGAGLRRMVILSGVVSGSFYALASLCLWKGLGPPQLFEDFLAPTFLPWGFFFFLGVYLGQRPAARTALSRWWWLFALATLGNFQFFLQEARLEATTFGDSPVLQFLGSGFPFQVLGALGIVGFFGWLGTLRPLRGPLAFFARFAALSMGVYLCHNVLLFLLSRQWVKLGWTQAPAVAVPSLWVAGFAAAMAAAFVGRYLWWPGRILFADYRRR